MNFFGFNLNVNPVSIFSLAFLVFVVFVGLVSIIMFWHWKRYGLNQKGIVLAEVIYLTGLLILGGGAFYELHFLI